MSGIPPSTRYSACSILVYSWSALFATIGSSAAAAGTGAWFWTTTAGAVCYRENPGTPRLGVSSSYRVLHQPAREDNSGLKILPWSISMSALRDPIWSSDCSYSGNKYLVWLRIALPTAAMKAKLHSLTNGKYNSERSIHYINNCLLLNPKGRAIKPLTRTKNGQNQLVFWCVLRLFFFSPFYFTAYSAENHASMSGFE